MEEVKNTPAEEVVTSGYSAPVEEEFGTWGKVSDLDLLYLFDPFLNKRPEPFDFATEKDTAADLARILYAKMVSLNGVGLSANQVGIDKRVFVVGSKNGFQAFFNPQIVGLSKETELVTEACLSMPGLQLALVRPAAVTLSFEDVEGNKFVATYDGFSSRIIQHEYDHMEGMNFTQLASSFKIRHEINKLRKKSEKVQRLVKRYRKRGEAVAARQAALAPLTRKKTT